MAVRVILIGLALLGFAIGICGGVEQAVLGRSICLVSQASENVDSKPVVSQLEEARQALDDCFNSTTASMYLGVAVALVAIIGSYFREKRPSSEGHSSPKRLPPATVQ